MNKCIHCGHAVSLGNQHARTNCPPPIGKTGEHHRRKARRKKAAKREFHVVRGGPVAGIHKKRGGESK